MALVVPCTMRGVRDQFIGWRRLGYNAFLLVSGVACPSSTGFGFDALLGSQLCLEHSGAALLFADVVELPLELLQGRAVRDGGFSLGIAALNGAGEGFDWGIGRRAQLVQSAGSSLDSGLLSARVELDGRVP
jgi:hypothetical protein